MNIGLKNKIALITGSSKELGFATAKQLAKEGAKVIISRVGLFALAVFFQPSISMASKIFVSNNERIITASEAYKRMHSKAQFKLINNTITTLKKYHYQQGRVENILGAYMHLNNLITFDNTLIFTTSAEETLNERRIFNTGISLAKQFNQQSVAVFIKNNNHRNTDTILKFKRPRPTYGDIKMKLRKLSASSLPAFSIHFQNKHFGLAVNKISEIEFLTTPSKNKMLKNIFKNAEINYKFGEAYLIFRDGHVKQID